ncbi:MAG: PstS family phosphate ABC transporter substrate-binding protein [Deltaproteobacteria bacterium]|nr:PstS family phosphate ABC transporter substrate-binding protein [Deltaproteobacteria bacterium]
MQRSGRKLLWVFWGALLLVMAGCRRQESIRADGSSTVFPITEAVAEEFQRSSSGVRVTVGVSGTGGGFKRFCSGETEISNASRPIKPSEVTLCAQNDVQYIEVPVAYDGIVLVVNPANTWATSLTVEELKRLWGPEAQGRIMRWNQIRPEWPDREIHLFGAGVDSGTYDYFTEAVVGKEHSSRGDYTASEDDNQLVQGVASDELALGFFGYAYYAQNQERLRAVPIDDGKPQNGSGPVAPTLESIREGTYQPLSRPILIYVSKRALERPEVASFVSFYIENMPRLADVVGYVPLPPQVVALAKERVEKRRLGSVFGGKGSQVGVSLDSLLQRERAAE